MGRLTKAKIDEIIKLRKQAYTQKETAEKAKVHLRTVRKYDPLRVQKPVRAAAEQVEELEETRSELAAEGLVREDSNGRFHITFLGRRTYKKLKELKQKEKAILEFMAEVDRPVTEEEIDDGLFDQALDEAKRHQN